MWTFLLSFRAMSRVFFYQGQCYWTAVPPFKQLSLPKYRIVDRSRSPGTLVERILEWVGRLGAIINQKPSTEWDHGLKYWKNKSWARCNRCSLSFSHECLWPGLQGLRKSTLVKVGEDAFCTSPIDFPFLIVRREGVVVRSPCDSYVVHRF